MVRGALRFLPGDSLWQLAARGSSGVLVAVSLEHERRPANERMLTGRLALRRQAPVGGCPTYSAADLQPSSRAAAWLRCPRRRRTDA
ncbi:hypothetical protein ACIQF5_21125 [Streptomyces goshikiensis]|uniref:hypothetical protein n=1 Tax=Streptomyces goshikiensis TaxID=1942 RepID=UPI0037F977B6